MDKITLGLSILNGEVRAASYAQAIGESAGAWDNLPELGRILQDVAAKAQGGGKTVAVALAHPRLIDQIVEVPPVRGWKLEKLLQRRAQTTKAFVGEAAWSHQAALPTKRGGAELLHVCPKSVMDQLTSDCQAAQLHLVRVLPTTAILANHLKSLPLAKDEVAMLAAETGQMTTVVVGRKDGRVCVGRVVRSNWNTDPERVGIDLTRSIGFAEQQSGLTVNSAWLFGAQAEGQTARLETLLKLPVKLSPVEFTPLYWAEQAATLSNDEDGNLVTEESQHALKRRRFVTLTTTLLCILALMTVATVSITEVLRYRERQAIFTLKGKIAELRAQQKDLQQGLGELEEMRKMAQVVNGEKLRPVPTWLLSYLGEAVPEGLVLTRLRIARTNDYWTVNLAGSSAAGTNQPAFRAAYESLTNRLARGPFHLAITRSALGKAGAATGATSSLLTDEGDGLDKAPENFELEGGLR